MTQRCDQMDLCTNCLNVQDCFYRKNKKEPVHFCEEFTCKDSGVSETDIKRLKRAETMFLPRADQGLFDNCGKPVP